MSFDYLSVALVVGFVATYYTITTTLGIGGLLAFGIGALGAAAAVYAWYYSPLPNKSAGVASNETGWQQWGLTDEPSEDTD